MFIINFQEEVIVCFSFTNILDTTYTFYSSCQSSSRDSCFLDLSLGDTSLSISFREDISEKKCQAGISDRLMPQGSPPKTDHGFFFLYQTLTQQTITP